MAKLYEPDFIAFTDGSAKTRDDGYASGCGLVIVDMSDSNISESSKTLGDQTNNFAELKAIQLALKAISNESDDCNVLIISDSKYCCESLSIYVHGWAKGKSSKDVWKSSTGTLKNQEIIKEIYYNYDQSDMKIKYVHMNSHLDHKNNAHIKKVIKSMKKVGLIINEKTAANFIRLNNRADVLADKAANKS